MANADPHVLRNPSEKEHLTFTRIYTRTWEGNYWKRASTSRLGRKQNHFGLSISHDSFDQENICVVTFEEYVIQISIRSLDTPNTHI